VASARTTSSCQSVGLSDTVIGKEVRVPSAVDQSVELFGAVVGEEVRAPSAVDLDEFLADRMIPRSLLGVVYFASTLLRADIGGLSSDTDGMFRHQCAHRHPEGAAPLAPPRRA